MFLSIAIMHQTAIDFGLLLHKHSERVHKTELGLGRATAFYLETTKPHGETGLCASGRVQRMTRATCDLAFCETPSEASLYRAPP